MRHLFSASLVTLLATLSPALLSAQSAAPLVLTADAQAALSPDAALSDLMAGNERFIAGKLKNQANLPEQVKATAKGQYPQAVILSCLDSRVPVELVFDQRIGDVFVARVAGNVENVDILGSMEFATAAAGAKLVMVLGHEACGAVKGACDHVQLGNLTPLLEKIQPAVVSVQDAFPPEQRTSKNAAFVERVIEQNVRLTVEDIRRNSPILAQLESKGLIRIVGALYNLHSGAVTLLD